MGWIYILPMNKWLAKRHPDYETLYYIETGEGKLTAMVTKDVIYTDEGRNFRLALVAPEMAELLEDLRDRAVIPPELLYRIENVLVRIDDSKTKPEEAHDE